jgi:hypothetical protein|nr:hypothetical protein [uncultured Allomuricauda sp.]
MAKIMYYGGKGGQMFSVPNFGSGKDLILFGGNDIDMIKIDNEEYGGEGGSEKGRAVIPQNGVVKVLEMQTHANRYIGYIKMDIGGKIIEAGDKKNEVYLTVDHGLEVKIRSINAGQRVDGIEFELVME